MVGVSRGIKAGRSAQNLFTFVPGESTLRNRKIGFLNFWNRLAHVYLRRTSCWEGFGNGMVSLMMSGGLRISGSSWRKEWRVVVPEEWSIRKNVCLFGIFFPGDDTLEWPNGQVCRFRCLIPVKKNLLLTASFLCMASTPWWLERDRLLSSANNAHKIDSGLSNLQSWRRYPI